MLGSNILIDPLVARLVVGVLVAVKSCLVVEIDTLVASVDWLVSVGLVSDAPLGRLILALACAADNSP